MHRSRFALIVMFGVALLLIPSAWAQENAIITGTVTDSTGAVVPNVEVTLTNPATGQVRKATSNTLGIYVFPSLGVGHYTISAMASGFHKFVVTDIVVNIAQTLEGRYHPYGRERITNGNRGSGCPSGPDADQRSQQPDQWRSGNTARHQWSEYNAISDSGHGRLQQLTGLQWGQRAHLRQRYQLQWNPLRP